MKIMRLSMRWKAISERDDLPQTDHLRFGVIVTDEGTRRNIVWDRDLPGYYENGAEINCG